MFFFSKDEVRNENIRKLQHVVKKDWYGWDIYWKRMTPEYLVKQYSGNWVATRESRDGRPRKNWMHIIRRELIERHGHYVRRSQRTGDRRSRMASTWGPMQPPGCVL